MISKSRYFTCLLLALVVISTTAFINGKPSVVSQSMPSSSTMYPTTTSTSLSERKWNFNEGRAPWGMKKNAEIWNGRVAQMAFVWVVLQELVTGKGIFKGIDEGDFFFIANAGLFGVCVVGLTAWLAIKGSDDYTRA